MLWSSGACQWLSTFPSGHVECLFCLEPTHMLQYGLRIRPVTARAQLKTVWMLLYKEQKIKKKKKTHLINCKLSWNNRKKLVNYLSVEVQKNKITMERIFTLKSRQTLCCGFKGEGRKCWFGPFWSLKACKSVIITFPSLAWERLSWSDSHFKELRINSARLSSVFLWSKQDSTNRGRLLFRVDQIFHQPQSQHN